MNEYENAENKGRTLFQRLFEKYFDTLYYSQDNYSFWDTSGITKNHVKKVIEIKHRFKYMFEDYSGSTIIEKHKVDEFKTLLEQHSDYSLIYICFYRDYWVAYNIDNRIVLDTNDLKVLTLNLPNTSVENNGYRDKDICYLKFDFEMGDYYDNYNILKQ